jgi:hypothetical protein
MSCGRPAAQLLAPVALQIAQGAGTGRLPDAMKRIPVPGTELIQIPRTARMDSRNDPIVASTADGSYPQCAMQLAHLESLPLP